MSIYGLTLRILGSNVLGSSTVATRPHPQLTNFENFKIKPERGRGRGAVPISNVVKSFYDINSTNRKIILPVNLFYCCIVWTRTVSELPGIKVQSMRKCVDSWKKYK